MVCGAVRLALSLFLYSGASNPIAIFLFRGRFTLPELTNVPTGPAGTASAQLRGVPSIPPHAYPILVVLETAAESEVGSSAPAGPNIASGRDIPRAAGQENTVHLQVLCCVRCDSMESESGRAPYTSVYFQPVVAHIFDYYLQARHIA